MDFRNVTDETAIVLLQRLNNVAVWKIHQGNTDHALTILKEAVALLQATPEVFTTNTLMINNGDKRKKEKNEIIPSILENQICCNCATAEQGGSHLRASYENDRRAFLMKKQKDAEDRQAAYIFGRGIMLGATNVLTFWNDRKGFEDIGEEECAAVRCSIIFYNLAVAYHKSSILHHGFTDTTKGVALLKKARSFYSMSMDLLTSTVFLDLFHRLCVLDDRKLLVGLVNNLGQIHFSLGNLEFGRHYFRQSQYWLGEMTAYSSLLYTSEELSGLVFNAMVLANVEEAQQYYAEDDHRRLFGENGSRPIVLVGFSAPVA